VYYVYVIIYFEGLLLFVNKKIDRKREIAQFL